MKNTINMTTEERLLTSVAGLKRGAVKLKANQAGTTLLTSTATASTTVGVRNFARFVATITPPNNATIISLPEFTIFKGSTLSAINAYPNGANFDHIMSRNVEAWFDWGETDSHNMKYVIIFKNFWITTIDITVVVRSRYLLTGAS